MRLEWMFNTIKGPAVGDKQVDSRTEAGDALEAAVRGAFDPYTVEHSMAVARMRNELATSELPFTYRSAGISVTLARRLRDT